METSKDCINIFRNVERLQTYVIRCFQNVMGAKQLNVVGLLLELLAVYNSLF